jgi:hypothetical protein
LEAKLLQVYVFFLRWLYAVSLEIASSRFWGIQIQGYKLIVSGFDFTLQRLRPLIIPQVVILLASPSYSAAMCAPFWAAEGFIRRTTKASITTTTAKIRNASK